MLQPLLLLQASAGLTPLQLRGELLKVAVAIILLSLGALAIALFSFRKKSRDLTLIYFGLFSLLYGARLLSTLQIIRMSVGYGPAFWGYVNWVITSSIILPFELFLYHLVVGRFKRFLRWLIALQAVLSLLGIAFAVFGVSLIRLFRANSASVLATLLLASAFYFVSRDSARPRQPLTREIRIFLAGFATWGAVVFQANLRSFGILSNWDVEFLGFFVFVCCLGYITASRSFAREELLLTINKELDIARQIQASTLPREVPRVSGLGIAARYLPMSAVAGDFYDFLVVDDQRLGILVADVTGHGVPAALIASMLKVAFAGQSEHAEDPARVLAGLNHSLCGKFDEHFVTAAYLFVDLTKGILRYAGAGHPPLLLLSASNGGIRAVQENGLMLGLFPEASYTSVEIPFCLGDRCLLYTDGLLEAMNAAQEEFGKERLAHFLQTHDPVPAARLAAALLEEVSRWSGTSAGRRQEDDITLLVLDFPSSRQGAS